MNKQRLMLATPDQFSFIAGLALSQPGKHVKAHVKSAVLLHGLWPITTIGAGVSRLLAKKA